MGVDHDNLEDSASVGVTAVILIVVSASTLRMIIDYHRNLKYRPAQSMLMLIFLMPVLIGWSAWIALYNQRDGKFLDFVMNLFKAICIGSFMLYVERMLGWVQEGSNNVYSEDKKYRILCSGVPHRFLCARVEPVKTVEEARGYVNKIRIAVFQLCAILIVFGIIGFSMIIATDNYSFTNPTQNTIFTVFSSIRAISSAITLISLLGFIIYVRKIPEMEHFEFMHKFIIIKLGLLFTEIQPIVIEFFADHGLIASTSKYSISTIASFTNSLLVVSEMIIICFLLLIVFPLSDYEVHPELRKSFVDGETKYTVNS